MSQQATSNDTATETGLRRDVPVFGMVFVLLVMVYLPTSSPQMPASIDPQTNALTAYLIAETGSPIARDYQFTVMPGERIGQTIWLVPSSRGPVSIYPPGAALVAVPLYWVANVEVFERERALPESFGNDGPLVLPDMWPAAFTSVIVTAAAMGFMALVLMETGLRRPVAATSAVVLGLATSIWSVAADALWQHGPAILWIAVFGLSLLRNRQILAGVAAAMAVLTRPPVAIILSVLTIGVVLQRRRLAEAAAPAIGLAAGTSLLLAFNAAIFEEISISGGYPTSFLENAIRPDLGSLAASLIEALLGPERGMLIWSPFLIFVLIAVPVVWRSAPVWTRASAIGGVLYFVVQYAASANSGYDFGFYRFPLEAIAAAAPIGSIAGQRILMGPRVLAFAFRLAIGLSILVHAAAALVF